MNNHFVKHNREFKSKLLAEKEGNQMLRLGVIKDFEVEYEMGKFFLWVLKDLPNSDYNNWRSFDPLF